MSFRTTARGPTGTPSAPPWTTKRKDRIPAPRQPGYVDRRIEGHDAIVEPQRHAPTFPEIHRPARGRDA